MLTRCPHCQTAFRVTSEQLKARQGQVRCGACHRVFDALESLADEIAVLAPAVAEPEPSPPAVETAPATEAQAEPLPELEFEGGALPEPALGPEPLLEPESLSEAAEEPGESEAAGNAEETATADEEAPAEDLAGVEVQAAPRRWPWLAGSVALLLLAAGQLLFFFRVELAVLAPELRPTLAAGCELLDCTLPYPRKPELVGIESSDLAPAGGERLVLTATLKNRAPFIQEYPHLELTLTDTRDEPLLRKVLTPADYLPADRPAAAGFTAQGEATVNLTLETAGVPAVGYRLYLFYP